MTVGKKLSMSWQSGVTSSGFITQEKREKSGPSSTPREVVSGTGCSTSDV